LHSSKLLPPCWRGPPQTHLATHSPQTSLNVPTGARVRDWNSSTLPSDTFSIPFVMTTPDQTLFCVNETRFASLDYTSPGATLLSLKLTPYPTPPQLVGRKVEPTIHRQWRTGRFPILLLCIYDHLIKREVAARREMGSLLSRCYVTGSNVRHHSHSPPTFVNLPNS